jgi:hypothetical protein
MKHNSSARYHQKEYLFLGVSEKGHLQYKSQKKIYCKRCTNGPN